MDCKCTNCGHEWITRSNEKPRVCPKCKNYNWFVPRDAQGRMIKNE